MNQKYLIFVGLCFLIFLVVIIFCNTKERFIELQRGRMSYCDSCVVQPRFNHYYDLQADKNLQPLVIGEDNSGSFYTTDCVGCIPRSKLGVVYSKDTDAGANKMICRDCGGDYPSATQKRDRYYQPEQGFLGDNILAGYPFYKAY